MCFNVYIVYVSTSIVSSTKKKKTTIVPTKSAYKVLPKKRKKISLKVLAARNVSPNDNNKNISW